jgi:hypothetical protein
VELPFDKYTVQARLAPMFVTLLPFSVGVAVWIPGSSVVWKYLGAMVISLPLTALLAQLGRELGKQKEPKLFELWGGTPTTRLLSYQLSSVNRLTLQRYHRKLAELLPDLAIPQAADEAQNPSAANRIYDSCVHFLRQKTQDHERYPLVFEENINYGFRRNLWALKPFGIASSAIGTASCGFFALRHNESASAGLVGTILSGALLVLWIFVFRPEWVRAMANAYAEQLLAALDVM